MKWFEGIDVWLWGTIILAITTKILLSPVRSIIRILTTITVGVFCAIVFTSPLLLWFELPKETYGYAVAGLLAVTGEELVRRVISVVNNPMEIMDLLTMWKRK